ncbi:MAG: molybdenum cofactor biosynthesis protein MoaE [Gemmatimonadaceae bacterium]
MIANLTDQPIDVAQLIKSVAGAECGATSVFIGVVRDENEGRPVTGIEYSAYREMALKELSRIVEEAAFRFGTTRIAVEHRLGYLTVGEASVAIAVGDPHRAPTLDATRHIIEELKRRVPIWKREHYVDGTREWVDPTGHRVEATP